MKLISSPGLVIRETYTGESDRIVTVLTRDAGVVRAFAKGARRPKSKLCAGTAFLTYSDFVICEGQETNRVNEASVLNVFPGIRSDIDTLATAEFFCELTAELAPQNGNAEDYLRLILNSLWFLSGAKIRPYALKPFFQFRILSMSGYMPDIVACRKCGAYETETMRFDVGRKCIYCENCQGDGDAVPLSVITSVRDMVLSELKDAFAAKIREEDIPVLNRLADEYLFSCTGRKYRTLEFIKTL